MLSLRSTLILCSLSLALAMWTCWAVAPVGMVPAFWQAGATLGPHFVAGFALVLAALASPFVFTEEELRGDAVRVHLLKAALAAMWLAVAVAFMMQTSARVAPVDGDGIVQASLWIFVTGFISILLNRVAPRSANAILFAWIFALPISGYMLAEVFLMSPAGGAGLSDSTAPQASAFRAVLHWTLNLSPGTATLGALTGTLADGSDYSAYISTVEWFAMAAVLMGVMIWRERHGAGELMSQPRRDV